MPLPLEGLRVLDFGQGAAGPYCGQLLGDHGADVIKVEPPRGDWSRTMGAQDASGLSGTFVSVNRNKRGLCLNFKRAEGVAIARSLALRADVIVESFRPGVMDRFGLDYEALRKDNPRLIYCDVTGFGASGPNVDLPAGDSIMQAYGGLMSIVGERDGQPLRVGNVVSDMIAGTNAFSGVLLALLSRGATGEGRRVSVALLDSIVAFQAPPLTEYLLTGEAPKRRGNEHPLIAPSGAVRTRDGAISLTVFDHQWVPYCAFMGVAHLADDPRFATSGARQQNRDALGREFAPVFAARSSAEWIALLREMDVLCAPINDYPALVEDPQVVHNELIQSARGADGQAIPMLRNPVRLESGTMRFAAPPRVGEHTREILAAELGYSAAQIDEAVSEGAVHCTSQQKSGDMQ